jgi:hypothetical protein
VVGLIVAKIFKKFVDKRLGVCYNNFRRDEPTATE